MAVTFTDTLKAAMLNVIETNIGASAKLRIYSGTPPANAGAALSGNTVLVDIPLGSDYFATTSNGVLTKTGTWQDTSADATGTATFFRILTSADVARIQGTVGTSGADLNLSSTSITSGGTVTITGFTLTMGN
jgi:hypothetical protein